MYRTFLAWRYLLTRPINLLGMFGIALSVWALVVVVSLFSGFLSVIEAHVQSAGADLTISQVPAYCSETELLAALDQQPQVAAAAGRLVHYGLIQQPNAKNRPPALPGRTSITGGEQPFLMVLGINSAREAKVTGLHRWLTDAKLRVEQRVANPEAPFASQGADLPVLVGQVRLEREGWRVGDPLRWTYATSELNEHGQRTTHQRHVTLRIVGAFRTQHAGFDGNYLLAPIQELRQACAVGSQQVHEIAVKLAADADLDQTATLLHEAFQAQRPANGTQFRVETWRERNSGFLESVAHQRALLKIVLIVILIVAAFLMLATLSMMVTEKTADIGILTALGGTPFGVTAVFLFCGVAITGSGVLLGLGSGVLTATYLEEIRQALLHLTGIDLFPVQVYNLDRVPCQLDPAWLLQVAAMAGSVGALVSGIPALRAARHDPLVSLRGS